MYHWSPEESPRFEGLTIPTQVNYVGKGANLYQLGYRFHGSAQVVTRYVRTAWLWDRVRVLGGAYGAFCLFNHLSGTLTFVSYRDPNLMKTLETFDQTGQFLKSCDLTERELTKSIIGTIDYSLFDPYMHTNALGPLKITETFLPHLRASKMKTVVAISSDGGTISVWDERPGFYFYAASKIALNMFMKRSAWDLREDGIIVVMFHPGFVRTEKLQDAEFEGMIELDESVPGMMRVIDNLTIEDTGTFMKHTGETQPW